MLFQSTLRRTERLDATPCHAVISVFQSTLRRTERLKTFSRQCLHTYFNPRSDERSDGQSVMYKPSTAYFNPRSDERSDRVVCSYRLLLLISIHAPTNGATIMLANTINRRSISIHAPTNGATSSPHSPVIIACHFNPRSDERSDCIIHSFAINHTAFQSTLRRTERRRPPEDNIIAPVFQSTLRRTERHCILDPYCLELIISIHAPTNGATR